MHEFRTRRKIEFADTDMEGIVHFSRFMIFMETAEHEFLEAIGTRVALKVGDQRYGWPRVSASCEYSAPACRLNENQSWSIAPKSRSK